MSRVPLYRNLLCVLAAGWIVLPVHAQPVAKRAEQPQGSSTYAITASVIAGGGIARATNACFELAGTIGQPTAGVSQGADYQLRTGFWGGAVLADSLFRSSFEECQQ